MNWKLSYAGPCLILSPGHCWYDDRKPEGLYLDDILLTLQSYPEKHEYRFEIPRTVKLGEAVEADRFDDIGTIQPHYSTVRIASAKQKRTFKKMPKNGRDLLKYVYNSEPMEVRE